MKLLLDANIVLELLLEQDRAKEAGELMTRVSDHDFFLTDFAFHSIGIALFQKRKYDKFIRFVEDMIVNAGTVVAVLQEPDAQQIVSHAQRYTLDFDDAYQYTAAEKYELTIVSFDSDFDKTERGRKTPQEVLTSA